MPNGEARGRPILYKSGDGQSFTSRGTANPLQVGSTSTGYSIRSLNFSAKSITCHVFVGCLPTYEQYYNSRLAVSTYVRSCAIVSILWV